MRKILFIFLLIFFFTLPVFSQQVDTALGWKYAVPGANDDVVLERTTTLPYSETMTGNYDVKVIPRVCSVLHVPTEYTTIQAALDAASPCDTVKVAAGIYSENLTLPSGVTLLGGYNISDWTRDVNEEITTIDGNGGNAVSIYNVDDVTIDGFRITNAQFGVGSGCCLGVVVSNNEIYDCTVGISSGSFACDSRAGFIIATNIFHDNYWYGHFSRYQDWLHPRIIRNNLFYDNFRAIYPMDQIGLQMTNNTIVYQSDFGIMIHFNNYGLVRNNIIAFNDSCGFGSYWYENGQVITHDYNDIFSNGTDYCGWITPDTTEISTDPLFVNSAIRDYHLLPSSPCIDAGDPDTIYNDPDGSRNDIGAFGGPGAAGWKIKPLLRGDVNADGHNDVSDVIYLISYLFKGGNPPECPSPYLFCSDVNCDGKVTVADVVYLINYLFKGGPPPAC